MHFNELLHKVFEKASVHIDKRLHRTLLQTSETLCECKHLSIAGLGRHLRSSVAVKHTIKRVDRLFGNFRLHHKRSSYYQSMVRLLVGLNQHPIILIDWSGLTRCGEYHFIRASVPVGGRSLVIWESTYLEKEYTSQRAHREFIHELKKLLPVDCKPIVVTDAGFRCPWFKLISQQGWYFIGRVRNTTQCQESGKKQWQPVKNYYTKATCKAHYLFSGLLAKVNPVEGCFYLMKQKHQHRNRKNLRGKKIQSSVSLKHAKREREPWLIFSSLPPEMYSPRQIMSIYKTRMQIEEAFRDLKNTRNGFSLRHCRSFDRQRLNIALLISAIAMFALWILGLITKMTGQHHLYQANTTRHRAVLSTFTIGWQSLKRNLRYRASEFHEALNIIHKHAQNELSY